MRASFTDRPSRQAAHAELRRRVDSLTVALFFAGLLYAVVRYVLGQSGELTQLPLHAVNKATALAGLTLFAAATVSGTGPARVLLGERSTLMVAAHVVLTLLLLDPTRYALLYTPDGGYTLVAQGALLCGALALSYLVRIFVGFTLGVRRLVPIRGRFRLGTVVLLLVALHLGLIGAHEWGAPQTWVQSMPPATLLGFVVIVLCLVIPHVTRSGRRQIRRARASRRPTKFS